MLECMPVDVEKRRFTADEYHQMGEAGIFSEFDRVELIEGEILTMSPIGSPHSAAVDKAAQTLILRAGARAIVRVQGPIRLNRFTEPEPDLVLLRPRPDFYKSAHPAPADVLLVIEIADTSLRFDREIKASLYARNAIAEYWLVDLVGQAVTCQSAPEDGVYRNAMIAGRGDTLSPRYLPDCTITVDSLLVD